MSYLENSVPLVTICVQTYQHEPFIKKCLESVLMQQANFPFEIIIGEDESTDGTREICMDYANKYPGSIRLFLRSRKDVIYINGKPTGRFNFLENMKAAKGKYIALLDGDDHWTDENKLQEQVAFLENHPDFALCFTNVRLINKTGETIVESLLNYPVDVFTHESFVAKISPPTLTTVFRKDALPLNFPDDFNKVTNADMFLKGILSEEGRVKFINKVTGNKCLHGAGVYAGTSSFQKEENKLKTYEAMLKYFKSKKVKNNIKRAMNIIYAKLLYNYLVKRKFKQFFYTLPATLRFYVFNLQVPPLKFFYSRLRNKKLKVQNSGSG
jgi:glycosyltransferase involved in cell wall biosynthesis